MQVLKISWYKSWRLLLLFICCISPVLLSAQNHSFLFDLKGPAAKGVSYFSARDYKAAIPYLELALHSSKYHHDISLREKLSEAYVHTGRWQEAAGLLEEIAGKKTLTKTQQLWYANALMAAGCVDEGRQARLNYIGMDVKDGSAALLAAEVDNAAFFRDSIRYSVQPVNINTKDSEYSPLVVGQGLMFVSDKARSGFVKRRFMADESQGHNLYYGRINEQGVIGRGALLSATVNTAMPEGPAAVYYSGKKIIFTRSTPRGDMQLFEGRTTFNPRSWVNIEPLQLPVTGSVAHPAVRDDGQLLYFVSDMPGGYGGTDIYRIEKTDSGWAEPQNLGPLVNTAGNEMFPVLHKDGSLFFASDGHYGLGGLDIYEASLENDRIVKVRNMGVPVNSSADDFSLSMHDSGHWGFFSSNRAGGAGKDDIYRLDVHILTLKGIAFDKTNRKRVAGARVNLLQEDKLLAQALTDENGNYAFELYPGQQYTLQMEAEEYRPEEQQLSTLQGPRYGAIQWETGLDRKVKMFVLGTIMNRAKQPADAARLLVIDQTNRKVIDTVYADHNGDYELELDTKSTYAFLADCEGEGAVSGFSTPEKGKASLSYYENIRMQPAKNYQVNGQVKSAKKGPRVLSLMNLLTLEQQYLFTDEEGNFTFEAYSLADYELCLPEGDAPAAIILTAPWHKPGRKVVLHD